MKRPVPTSLTANPPGDPEHRLAEPPAAAPSLRNGLVPATLGAACAALVEVFSVVAAFPTAASRIGGLVALLVAVIGLFGMVAFAIATALSLVDRVLPRRTLPDAPRLVSALALAAVTTGVLFVVDDRLAGGDYEFRRLVQLVQSGVVAGVVLVALLAAPGLAHLGRRLGPRAVAVSLAATGLLLQLFSHFVLASIHLSVGAGLATAAAIGLYGFALRLALPPPSVAARRFVPWVVPACALAGVFATPRSPTAAFLLAAHAPGAGPFARLERAVFDVDHDGSAAILLGGADCAPFDSKRAPTAREIPGDGIDQDCRGGDAREVADHPEPHRTLPAGCSVDGPLSIALITIDALRADALRPEFMPNLAHLAETSVRFERAYAPATMTNASLPAMFTGRPYSDLVAGNPLVDPDPVHVEPFTVDLARAGFGTVAFDVLDLDPDLQRGFQEWNPAPLDFTFEHGRRPLMSAALVNAALSHRVHDFFDRIPTGFLEDGRSFLWLHLPDVHAPYRVDALNFPGLSSYARGVAYTDQHLGRLITALRGRFQRPDFAIVVTADHGEELDARGRQGHGPNLFEEVARVPLIVSVPGCAPRIVKEPVSLVELAATIRGLAGLPARGRTLFDDAPRPFPVVVEEDPHGEGSFKRAIYDGTAKLVVDPANGGKLLFDLAEDPLELWNLVGERPDLEARLEAGYQRWLDAPGVR